MRLVVALVLSALLGGVAAAEDDAAIRARLNGPPAAFEAVPAKELRGPIAALEARAGKRIRAIGKVTTQGRDDLKVTQEGSAPKAYSGTLVALVPVSRTRLAACAWKGRLGWEMSSRLADGAQVALVGTLAKVLTDKKPEIILLTDCDVPVTLKPPPPVQLARFEASKLTRAYESNRLAASKEYDDYELEVAGVVHTVTQHGWVHLRGHRPGLFVYCELAQGVSDEAIASLARGRRTVLRGVVRAFHDGDWRELWDSGVLIGGCTVVGRK